MCIYGHVVVILSRKLIGMASSSTKINKDTGEGGVTMTER